MALTIMFLSKSHDPLLGGIIDVTFFALNQAANLPRFSFSVFVRLVFLQFAGWDKNVTNLFFSLCFEDGLAFSKTTCISIGDRDVPIYLCISYLLSMIFLSFFSITKSGLLLFVLDYLFVFTVHALNP